MEVGTILAVVQIATKVLSLLSKYYRDVKDAKDKVKRLSEEIETFQNVLQNVRKIVEHSPSKLPTVPTAAIVHSQQYLSDLEEKLNPPKQKKMMDRVGLRALKWPFTNKEVEEWITWLNRDKTTLVLALNSDQT